MAKKEFKLRYIFIAFFGFFLGYTLLIYPSGAAYLMDLQQSDKNAAYLQKVDEYPGRDRLLESAQKYNEKLKTSPVGIMGKYPDNNKLSKEYLDQLKVEGTDVISQVLIKSANISLPIYHGTSDPVLDKGAGHLYGSSLPVGGKGTNAVITAHTGLASAKMFDNLTKVNDGDEVKLLTLGEVRIYKVIDKRVMSPEDVIKSFKFDESTEFLTLITCTPYSINTHRLVVSAVFDRVEEASVGVVDYSVSIWPAVLICIGYGVMLLLLLICLLLRKKHLKN